MTDSALEQKAVEIIDNIQNLAEPAMQVTLRAVQAGAVIDLLISTVVLVACVVIGKRFLPGWWKALKESDYCDVISAGARFWAGTCACVFPALIAVCSLLSTSNWLAAFAPELALARMLIAKVS